MLRKINEENGLLRDKYERIKRDKNRADDNELEKMAARIG